MDRHALVDHGICLRKSAVNVAVGKRVVPENIRTHLFEDQRRVGPERFLRVQHGRQGIVLHPDEIGRILRSRPVYRRNPDDRLTDVAHLLIG